MKILITGASGFIGRHLAQFLGRKHFLLTPKSHELDLTSAASVSAYLKYHPIDLVIHAASQGVRITPDAPEAVADDNIAMFQNLAHVLPPNARMISLGSGAEYDKCRDLNKITEEKFGAQQPADPYGYSKYIIACETEQSNNMVNLRIFGVYGPGENPTRFTSYAICQNLKRQPITINQNVVFDFIFIDDLVHIINFFVENIPAHKAYNITPTQSINLVDLAKIVNDISDFHSEITVAKPGLNYEYTGDNSRLLQEMGGFKFTAYPNGIKILYDFLQPVCGSR